MPQNGLQAKGHVLHMTERKEARRVLGDSMHWRGPHLVHCPPRGRHRRPPSRPLRVPFRGRGLACKSARQSPLAAFSSPRFCCSRALQSSPRPSPSGRLAASPIAHLLWGPSTRLGRRSSVSPPGSRIVRRTVRQGKSSTT